MVDSGVQSGSNQQNERLAHVVGVLPIVADLARADVLLCVRCTPQSARVLVHARPHSIASVYRTSVQDQVIEREAADALFAVFAGRKYARSSRGHARSEGAPVEQEALPVPTTEGEPAALLFETNLIERERMRRRDRMFQDAIRNLKQMATLGEPVGAEKLEPFGEHDGVLAADDERVIVYVSGIATNLYRRIGYPESLIGKPLSFLETQDDLLARTVFDTGACVQVEGEERGRQWVKKALPIREFSPWHWPPARRRFPRLLLLLQDNTDLSRQRIELQIKTTMIKEVHHRVKNDLQTVAALLRMQSRRMQTDEAKGALADAVNRILSIAVIHEFLSVQDTRTINLRDVAQRILTQTQTAVLDPSRPIQLSLNGPNIYLPARQATSCALVVNELLQNALEHGFGSRPDSVGSIVVTFQDEGSHIRLAVYDDGRGLPPEFDLNHVDSLGLRIVRMLVQEDLRGQFELVSNGGVSAIVRFPKTISGGEEAWTEPV